MKHIKSKIFKALIYISGALSFLILAFIVVYILVKGVPHLKPSLFEPKYTSENVSMLPAIVNTLVVNAFSLIIAVPLGIFTAIYLNEYAGRGNKMVVLIRLTAETLAGIPSIVYGLFGMLMFVTYLNMGYSIISGSLTLAIMILPLIMRTTEEALKSVPDSYREASLALGAGKLRTIVKILLPSATRGIFAGVILALGRITGETAALIYTCGTVAQMPKNIFSSGRTLAVHMYSLSREGLNTGEAFATGVVLLLFVLFINTLSAKIARRIGNEV